MVAGTTSLGDEKPPDLWIHHEQMELKNCKGENHHHHHPPDGVASNRNSQDVSSIEDHYMGTLDKKKSLYMGKLHCEPVPIYTHVSIYKYIYLLLNVHVFCLCLSVSVCVSFCPMLHCCRCRCHPFYYHPRVLFPFVNRRIDLTQIFRLWSE